MARHRAWLNNMMLKLDKRSSKDLEFLEKDFLVLQATIQTSKIFNKDFKEILLVDDKKILQKVNLNFIGSYNLIFFSWIFFFY